MQLVASCLSLLEVIAVIDEIIFRDSVQKPECEHQETSRKFAYPEYGIEFCSVEEGAVIVTHLESGKTRYYPVFNISSWTKR